MAADDLSFLPSDLQSGARCDANGEVSWHVSQASDVIRALAEAGRKVLGLDVRNYETDDAFTEVAWTSYSGCDVRQARDYALNALSSGDLPGEWVLVTW